MKASEESRYNHKLRGWLDLFFSLPAMFANRMNRQQGILNHFISFSYNPGPDISRNLLPENGYTKLCTHFYKLSYQTITI